MMYEYKVVQVYVGSYINEWDFNELGKQGYRLVHVKEPFDDGNDTTTKFYEFVFERERTTEKQATKLTVGYREEVK